MLLQTKMGTLEKMYMDAMQRMIQIWMVHMGPAEVYGFWISSNPIFFGPCQSHTLLLLTIDYKIIKGLIAINSFSISQYKMWSPDLTSKSNLWAVIVMIFRNFVKYPRGKWRKQTRGDSLGCLFGWILNYVMGTNRSVCSVQPDSCRGRSHWPHHEHK